MAGWKCKARFSVLFSTISFRPAKLPAYKIRHRVVAGHPCLIIGTEQFGSAKSFSPSPFCI